MEFNKLQQMDIFELDGIELEFVTVHNQIITYGQMLGDSILQLSKNLSEMKKKELYKTAGFATFGEYSENAVGLKERQAYKYASIYDNLPQEFLHSSAKIGVTKLALLASISDEKREEIKGEINIETASVSELKKALKEKEIVENENVILKENLERLNQSVVTLEDYKKAEEERVLNKTEELNKLKDQLQNAKMQREKIASELEQKRAELLAQPEIETVEKIVEVEKIVQIKDEESEKKVEKLAEQVEKLQSEIEARTAEVEKLNKKIATSDEMMTKFKLKFEDLQKTGIALFEYIGKMDDEKQAKCRMAISTVVDGWKL